MIPAHGTRYVQRIISRLIIERTARMMNQRDMGALAGVRQCSISNIEAGKVSNPGLGTIAALAAAIGLRIIVVPDYLEQVSRLDRAEMAWVRRMAEDNVDASPVARSLVRKLKGDD